MFGRLLGVSCYLLMVSTFGSLHAQEESPPQDPIDLAEFFPGTGKTTAISLIESFGEELGITVTDGLRELPFEGLSIIKYFEGFEPSAYDDPAGYCTIGYGHLIALKNCAEIDLGEFASSLGQDDAEKLLVKDSSFARGAVMTHVGVDLNDDQFAALSSFVFNVGTGNFQTSTMLKLLNEGEYELAGLEFGRWVKARGEILPGLVTRRACEHSLFLSELDIGANGTFDAASCNQLGLVQATGSLLDIEAGE